MGCDIGNEIIVLCLLAIVYGSYSALADFYHLPLFPHPPSLPFPTTYTLSMNLPLKGFSKRTAVKRVQGHGVLFPIGCLSRPQHNLLPAVFCKFLLFLCEQPCSDSTSEISPELERGQPLLEIPSDLQRNLDFGCNSLHLQRSFSLNVVTRHCYLCLHHGIEQT